MAAAQSGAHLYVIMGATGDLKIGRSKNPKKRMSDMQVSHSVPLRLIGTLRGSGYREKEIHAALARYRVAGEWFRDCAQIRSEINAIFGKELPFLGSREKAHLARKEREHEEATARIVAAILAGGRHRPRAAIGGEDFASYKARSDERHAARLAKKRPALPDKLVAVPPARSIIENPDSR